MKWKNILFRRENDEFVSFKKKNEQFVDAI